MPTLWKMDSSPPASAVRILGEILGIQFDCIDVDFFAMGHKAPEYMKRNPLGTVPVLKDGDFILTDSHAQMKYLLGKYGKEEQRESLYPSDLQAQAIVDQAMFFDTGVFFIKLKIIALPTVFDGLAGLTDRLIEELETSYTVVETYLGNNQFVAGNRLTLADLSLGCTAVSLDSLHAIDKDRFPKTTAWLDRLNNIPAFKKYSGGPQTIGPLLRSIWEKKK